MDLDSDLDSDSDLDLQYIILGLRNVGLEILKVTWIWTQDLHTKAWTWTCMYWT